MTSSVTPIHFVYGLYLKSLALGRINVKTHVIKGLLCTAGYVPNQHTHEFKSSVDHETTGSGYAAGGQVVTGIDTIYTGSAKKLTITAGTLNWPVVTFNPGVRYLVVYDDSWPDQTNKPLMMYVDFGADQLPNNQAFYYQWPGNIMMEIALP
jgi:hypothetical protein